MAAQSPRINFREPYRHKIDYPDGDREEAYADAVAEGIAPEQAALLLTAPSFLECIRRDGASRSFRRTASTSLTR